MKEELCEEVVEERRLIGRGKTVFVVFEDVLRLI